MTVKNQIFELVNLVPDNDLATVLEVIKHFVPIDVDDIATVDDIAAHEAALKEYAAGKTIGHDAINWD